jgi:hypothetical protein
MGEANEVDAYVRTLPQSLYEVTHYGFLNQRNRPPSVYAILASSKKVP